jgi:hypothetical protein
MQVEVVNGYNVGIVDVAYQGPATAVIARVGCGGRHV